MTIAEDRWITTEDFDAISKIVTDYFNIIRPGKNNHDEWLMGLKTALSNGEREIFVSYDENHQPVGFAIFNVKFNRIQALYAKGDAQTERILFDNVFNDLRIRKPMLNIYGEYLSDVIIDRAEKRRFKRFDIHGMSISRTSVTSWVRPELPLGYILEVYSPDMLDESAEFMYESHKKTRAAKTNPNWFGTVEGWHKFLELRKSNWIRVLRFEEMIVGMFIAIVSSTEGKVNGFAIRPSFRRKGLGKTLLVHTLQDLMASKENIENIILTVDQDNSAVRVYESLGFEISSTFPIFAWSPENTD